MGLIPLYDAGGNPLLDAGGFQIYLQYEGPTQSRLANVPAENRVANVAKEIRVVDVRKD